jgi:hypothetical protein
VGIQARYVLQLQAHPRRMHDNDGESVQAWHECGLDDMLSEIHVYEIESLCVTLIPDALRSRYPLRYNSSLVSKVEDLTPMCVRKGIQGYSSNNEIRTENYTDAYRTSPGSPSLFPCLAHGQCVSSHLASRSWACIAPPRSNSSQSIGCGGGKI